MERKSISFALSCLVVLFCLADGQISPDSAASYSGCPACDLSSDISEEMTNMTMTIVGEWVEALLSREPESVASMFCSAATLTATVSQAFRSSPEEILSYFEYFARLENEVLSLCPQVIGIADDLTKANIAVNLNGDCLRMSFTVNVKDGCVQNLYSSQFPNDPLDLREEDAKNEMPWGDADNTKTVPGPNTVKGTCPSCEAKVLGDLPQDQVDGVKGVLNKWVSGLLDQDPKAITDTYCNNSFLWGTVSNIRRNSLEEIESYFNWFANSRNFSEAVKGVCSTISRSGESSFWDDRTVLLGDQCLRMSYIVVKEGNDYCIKSLSSSYFPEEPEGLQSIDRKNNMPWTQALAEGPSSNSEEMESSSATLPVMGTAVALLQLFLSLLQ